MDVHYAPGSGVLVARGDRWLLLEAGSAGVPQGLLEQLWRDLEHPGGLAAAAATVRAHAPGAAVAALSADSGERLVEGAASVERQDDTWVLRVGSGSRAEPTLPLLGGVVAAEAAVVPCVAPATATGSHALIDGIPPEILAASSTAPAGDATTPPGVPEHHTVRRAPLGPETDAVQVTGPAAGDTDHDRHTRLRAAGPVAPAGSEHLQQATSDTVLAARCEQGHLTDSLGPVCRSCGRPVPPQEPVRVLRPPLGVLDLPDGGRVLLDRPVVLGRSPHPTGAGDWPHLVRLPHEATHLSRMHLRVDLDGWHVLAVDLGSRGGSTIALPGRDPERIRPGEPHLLEHGAVVDLAESYRITYLTTWEADE